MKNLLILLLFFLSNTVAAEVPEFADQPISPWKRAANFLGFSLSTEFQVPPATSSKIIYGFSCIGLGITEILASEQLATQKTVNSPIPTIFSTAILPHAFSNIFSGVSILGDLMWDTTSNYMGVPAQKSNTIKNSIYNKINGGTQIITGLYWMRLPPPYFLPPGVGFFLRGCYNLWRTDTRLNQNRSPWDRICHGVTRFSASLALMDFYFTDLSPSFFLPTREIHAITTGTVIYDPYNSYYLFNYNNSSSIICKHIAQPPTFPLVTCCPGKEIIDKFINSLEITPHSYSKMIFRNVCRLDRHDGWWTVDELLSYTGLAELVGGIKDTLFLFNMMLLASFKIGDDEDSHAKKIVSQIKQSQRKARISQGAKQQFSDRQGKRSQPAVNQQPASITAEASWENSSQEPDKGKYVKEKPFKENEGGKGQQKWQKPEKKNSKKENLPEKKPVLKKEPAKNLTQIQEQSPAFLPPDFPVKPKSLNWRQARTRLKQYGLTIDDEAEGSRIKLKFGDATRTLHIHKSAGSKVRGGRLQDILYMLWVASQAQLESRGPLS